MKPIRNRSIIALFFHRYRWGIQIRGDERGFLEKAKEFQALGFDLRVFEIAPSFQEEAHVAAYSSLKVPVSRVPPKNPFEVLAMLLSVLGTTIRNRLPLHPVAIYSYNQDVENVLPGLVLKILTGAPLVVIHHQIDPSAVLPFDSSFHNRRKSGYKLTSSVWRSILPAINRFSLLRADSHIALSESAKRDIEQAVGVTGCIVVGNGLDTKKFSPMDLPRIYDAVFLGRLAPQKGIDILLKAWKKVVGVQPTAKLVLIGGGDEVNLRKYRDMISELDLKERVDVKGFQSDERVVELLNSSKLFVFPSRKEGFAQAVSQAMACGLCCVLSDIPALREYYGKGSILVPPENSEALASTLIELLSDESKQDEFRKISRSLVVGLSWRNAAEGELEEIFKAGNT